MSKISIEGNVSGTGTLTIAAPNTSTNYTLALPEEAGTITTSNSPYSTFRNRIINGDCRIAQRGTAAVTASGAYPVDRFLIAYSMDGAVSLQQDSSAPTGFVNSVKFTTTTADASLSASQYVFFQQRIEGTNIADLAWGTASAKTITLSFWVRSSLTGTFGGSLVNGGFNRSYPFTYTISTADTWEQKSVTIAGDTTGTWLTTTGVGIRVNFGLGVGSTFSGTAGAWAASELYAPTGATSVIGTLNATWYITGVQLEVGSVATPFERIDYGRQLIQCQRYFSKSFAIETAPANVTDGSTCVTTIVGAWTADNAWSPWIPLPATMRAAPTLTFFRSRDATNGQWSTYNGSWAASSTTETITVSVVGFNVGVVRTGGFTIAGSYLAQGHWTAQAEL